jgi:type II secretory pathway component GspD/PulD (secretin)
MKHAWSEKIYSPLKIAAISLVGLVLCHFSSSAFAQSGQVTQREQTVQLEQPAPQPGQSGDAGRLIQSGSSVPSGQVGFGLGPKPIVIEKPTETLEERLQWSITLDVREMNIVDVLKFLALKGDFNMVTSRDVAGRITLFLKNVKINDALDIVVIANRLAYHIDKEIVHVMSEAEYEANFGKRFNDQNIVEIIQLKYAKPSYTLAALDSLKSALGRIIIDEDTGSVVIIDTPASVARMKQAIAGMESPLEAVVYHLQYAKADTVAEKLKGRVDALAVGSITVDERTNTLIVRAFPGRRSEIEGLLKSLDKPTKEVLVEARVLQVVFKPQMDFGIDWSLDFRHSNSALNDISFQNAFLNEDGLASGDNLFSRYAKIAIGDFDEDQFETAIRALKQVNDTKILSNPKILVTNNEEAKIHIGDTIPYIISTTSGTGDNAITSEDVRFVDVGLKLNVTPTINDEGYVTMVLKPEISTVVGQIESQGGGIPQVNRTLVETTVMVKDGMTIVLGGLKKDNRVKTRQGIPFLMDLPYVKNFFSNTSESIESTEIVIFLTPHIMSGDQDEWREYKGIMKPNEQFSRDQKPKKEEQVLKLKD